MVAAEEERNKEKKGESNERERNEREGLYKVSEKGRGIGTEQKGSCEGNLTEREGGLSFREDHRCCFFSDSV